MKKMLSLVCVVLLCFGLVTPALAYGGTASQAGVRQLSAGTNHSALIDENGTVWVWGDASSGKLGLGGTGENFITQSTPAKLMDDAYAVSCGGGHTAVIKNDKSLWIFGHNSWEELGIGKGNAQPYVTVNCQTVPKKIMDDVIAVSCGGSFTAAIKSDGTLWLWGINDEGQIGNGGQYDKYIPYHNVQTTPVKIMDNVAAVSCGNRFAAALKKDGSLWTWGSNECGQLGNGGVGNARDDADWVIQTVPVKIMDNVASFSCGSVHAAAVKTDGSLWLWGNATTGAMGNGAYSADADISQTTPFKLLDGVKSVSCGGNITAVIKNDNSLWMFGINKHGQLGTGRAYNATGVNNARLQTVPDKVLDDVAAVVCGGTYVLTVRSDGSIWGWGDNENARLGNGGGGNETVSGSTVQTTPVLLNSLKVNLSSTSSNTPATVGAFTDVLQSAYYADAVQWAVENNITSGTSTTTFSPAANIDRAQAVTFLWRMKNCPEPKTSVSPFADVQDTSSWYYKAVLWAAENNITSGTSATTFSPNGNVTRGQMITLLYRMMGEPGKTGTGEWYADAESWARQNRLLDGTATAYSTGGDCPRSDVVYYLWKTFAK